MSGLELFADSETPEWVARVKLLGLFGAMAAYLGAVRLWFHKARADALDGIQKERPPNEITDPTSGERKANPAAETYHPKNNPKVKHLAPRLVSSVMWLRLLAPLDLLVLFGAGVLFVSTFGEFLPGSLLATKSAGRDVGKIVVVNLAWLALLGVTFAHARSGLDAWFMPSTFENPLQKAGYDRCWVAQVLLAELALIALVPA